MMKILIVDDDEYITDLLRQFLSPYYNVTTFNCPVKALVHYSENVDYSIVYSDFHMSKLDGDELVEQMLDINHKQKFILCTASLNKRLIDIANTHLNHIFLCDKPFDLHKFKALCESMIENV